METKAHRLMFPFHLAKHLDGILKMAAEVLAHYIEHIGKQRIAQGIEDLVCVLPRNHQVVVTKHRKVLGEIRRLDTDLFENRSHGGFSVAQYLNDVNSGRVREGFKNFGFESSERIEMGGIDVGGAKRHLEKSYIRKNESTQPEPFLFLLRSGL
ncbi:MAG TPA: hypothetical protein VHY22_01915, partial [Chthoniobacteraceae bacterium]|nr:hypothetical protein [Chthoniobacteraceae bacterium]